MRASVHAEIVSEDTAKSIELIASQWKYVLRIHAPYELYGA